MTNSSKYEDNPFQDEIVAKEWINSTENEKGMIREKELLPQITNWVKEINPNTVVDIGMGQGGCADAVQVNTGITYIGIEPSERLVERAREIHSRNLRQFLIGNAYELPLEDSIADAALSINVWFHLKDLEKASSELARILKPQGKLYICTANPDAYANWRSRFDDDAKEDEFSIDGKVYVPINPLSRNIIFKHTLKSIIENLEKSSLSVDKTLLNGYFDKRNGEEVPLFINIFGHK